LHAKSVVLPETEVLMNSNYRVGIHKAKVHGSGEFGKREIQRWKLFPENSGSSLGVKQKPN